MKMWRAKNSKHVNGKNRISVLFFSLFLSVRFTMAHRINLVLFDFLCSSLPAFFDMQTKWNRQTSIVLEYQRK